MGAPNVALIWPCTSQVATGFPNRTVGASTATNITDRSSGYVYGIVHLKYASGTDMNRYVGLHSNPKPNYGHNIRGTTPGQLDCIQRISRGHGLFASDLCGLAVYRLCRDSQAD